MDLTFADQDPGATLYHVLLGADYELLPPGGRFGVRTYAGLGAAIVDGPIVRAPLQPGSQETFPLEISERWFELATGLEAHYRVHRFFEPFARVRAMVAFPGDEVVQFSFEDPDAGDGPLWSFPLQLGVRASF
ncbi:MAG: hypothetical protein RRA92_02585 [Gemmatimonadota bacterium]|nr:hypothetical protein [Gemmatimonadota bacterium]